MPIQKRQLKITKLFKRTGRNGARAPRNVLDDCKDLQEEVRQIEEKLKEKQTELFQLQRESIRKKASPPSPHKKKNRNFVRPQRIALENSIETTKKTIELISMLTGKEVQYFVSGDYCCVVFHMQHSSEYPTSHGLRIDMHSGKNEISGMSLPLGFNLAGVMEDYDNVMKPECLNAIQKALYAYYNRLQQYNNLKKLLNIEAELFKVLDGSHMQISVALTEDEEEDPVPVTILLDYKIYDIRPSFSFKDDDNLPEDMKDVLNEQCAVFMKKPLHKAFQDAFMGQLGQYKFVPQWGCLPRPMPRPRPKKRALPHNPHNDDTFRPEDCSEQSDEEEDTQ